MSIVTLLIFIMGMGTVVLSVWAAHIFSRANHGHLSTALTWQLIGEAIMGACTMTFAAGAHFGWLDNWSEAFQSAMRFTMFLATSGTTFHLVRTIRNL